jgi:hypothetical protein
LTKWCELLLASTLRLRRRAEECDYLRTKAQPRLEPSIVTHPDTAKPMLNQARTSTGMFFNRNEDDVIERIEERIAAWTMLATKNGEGIQVLHYEVCLSWQQLCVWGPQPGLAVTTYAKRLISDLAMVLKSTSMHYEGSIPRQGRAMMPVSAKLACVVYTYLLFKMPQSRSACRARTGLRACCHAACVFCSLDKSTTPTMTSSTTPAMC